MDTVYTLCSTNATTLFIVIKSVVINVWLSKEEEE